MELVIFIIILILQLIGAHWMAQAAKDKGYGPEAHIMAKCFWLGIFGYLYALSLPDKILQQEITIIRTELVNQRQETISNELPEL